MVQCGEYSKNGNSEQTRVFRCQSGKRDCEEDDEVNRKVDCEDEVMMMHIDH